MFKEDSRADVSSLDETSLWKRYVSSQDEGARAELIRRHLPTAQKLAAALYSGRFDDSVEFGDYLQYARVGLLEAIERYDPAREASFTTFATYRIRGAILNGIQKATEIATQRAQRRRLRREQLKSIKEEGGTEKGDAFTRMVDLTLSLAIGYLLEESGLWKAEEADRAADPYTSLELKRLAERMALLVGTLPEREQRIVRHHYFEHKDFTEIGGILGISKGRVSQLHARALDLLRTAYDALQRTDQRI